MGWTCRSDQLLNNFKTEINTMKLNPFFFTMYSDKWTQKGIQCIFVQSHSNPMTY
jgi:hypothetical protein